jgi:hypothetical protein
VCTRQSTTRTLLDVIATGKMHSHSALIHALYSLHTVLTVCDRHRLLRGGVSVRS